MSGKLVFWKPLTGSGKLVFGDSPDDIPGSQFALARVFDGVEFVDAAVKVFDGANWEPRDLQVTHD